MVNRLSNSTLKPIMQCSNAGVTYSPGAYAICGFGVPTPQATEPGWPRGRGYLAEKWQSFGGGCCRCGQGRTSSYDAPKARLARYSRNGSQLRIKDCYTMRKQVHSGRLPPIAQ